jgi:type I restriction enzyme R subunit
LTQPEFERQGERDQRAISENFEKAIHITTTDVGETYVIRTISDFFEDY